MPPPACLIHPLRQVSPLLRALILALLEKPLAYDRDGRGGQIAALALAELRLLKIPALHLPMPSERRLHRLCQELIANPESRETLATLAEQQATSSRTLARQFQRETGMSFRQWRQQARRLLFDALGHLANNMPVALVAEKLGYRSASAFTAMFLVHAGQRATTSLFFRGADDGRRYRCLSHQGGLLKAPAESGPSRLTV